MRINNQPIIETDTHLLIRLHEPFWGAWQKYSWEKGIEGFGLSLALIKRAKTLKKKLMVSFPYGRYEITPRKACNQVKKYNSRFIAKDGTELYVIPRNACERIGK